MRRASGLLSIRRFVPANRKTSKGIARSLIGSAPHSPPSLSLRAQSSSSITLPTNRSLVASLPLPDNMVQLWIELTQQLEEKVRLEDERHQRATRRSWELNAALVRAEMVHDVFIGGDAEGDAVSKTDATLDELVRETVLSPDMYNTIVHGTSTDEKGGKTVHRRAPRVGNMIGSKMEDYARYKAFRHFLAEEKLLSPNAPCFVITDDTSMRNVLSDEEYLGGACIGLCHDLAKYGVTKASEAAGDESVVPFIKRARDAVSLILEELLQFDFRNGPLRRKYDSTKYALKMLEVVLYELSVAGKVGGIAGLAIEELTIDADNAKKAEEETEKDGAGELLGLPKEEIGAIRERMDHRDKLREMLIKTTRDGQKAAKQAIFAMHRGDAAGAAKLLGECMSCVQNDLMPILDEEPALRQVPKNSHSEMDFFYIFGPTNPYPIFVLVKPFPTSAPDLLLAFWKGRLFYTWLFGDLENAVSGSLEKPVGKIMLPEEFPLNTTTDDYLGGLCDLTGEIGRYAVSRGTVRDKQSVKMCLDSNKAIHMTLKMLGKVPKGIQKKVNMVCRSVEKLERMQYEQSLMEMTGRKEFSTAARDNDFDRDGGD
ncbi:hypothetical protein ACHAWF_008433 [Thalassiosira exigua]